MIINGEHPVRKAARNELRKGAHVIKIMASGGIASPTDPIANLQFSEAEIRAIVEEASFWGSYVMAHVRDARLQSLEYLNEASTRIGFGTDLFGVLQSEQSRELQVRAEVDSNVDVLKSVTSGNAELLNMSGKSGCIKVGEFADLLVLRKNPLTDLSVLQEQGMHIEHIIKAGQIVDRSRHSLATH
ncbi:MAG TPA: amidohydrolase family protein [Woeseiaceae bacterium]|nr:amidohydrolase family protein [Woeseiaceae bacterium]